MEDPRPKMQEALKDAIKNKDNRRRDVIRLAQSALKQVEVDTRKELSAEDVITTLQKEVKKLRESAAEKQQAGRADEAALDHEEIAILEEFLPRQLSREEIVALVQDAIAQSGATSAKEMGKVMGILTPKTKGIADGKLVNEIVREYLK